MFLLFHQAKEPKPRLRRQDEESQLLEGSGSDVEEFGEDDEEEDAESGEDSSPVVTPSQRSPTFDLPSSTAVMPRKLPSTTTSRPKKVAVRPAGQIEPTAVLVEPSQFPPEFTEDFTNGSFILEPVEPTLPSSGLATPPLPEDLGAGPNLIRLDGEEEDEDDKVGFQVFFCVVFFTARMS